MHSENVQINNDLFTKMHVLCSLKGRMSLTLNIQTKTEDPIITQSFPVLPFTIRQKIQKLNSMYHQIQNQLLQLITLPKGPLIN